MTLYEKHLGITRRNTFSFSTSRSDQRALLEGLSFTLELFDKVPIKHLSNYTHKTLEPKAKKNKYNIILCETQKRQCPKIYIGVFLIKYCEINICDM